MSSALDVVVDCFDVDGRGGVVSVEGRRRLLLPEEDAWLPCCGGELDLPSCSPLEQNPVSFCLNSQVSIARYSFLASLGSHAVVCSC